MSVPDQPDAPAKADATELLDRPEVWPVQSSQDLHRDGWIVALRADQVTRPGVPEEPFRRLTLEHPGAVVVLALDEQDRVFCLRQYRHPAQMSFVELPAGLRDADGEPPVETARRELVEEAELSAAHWRELLVTFPSAGITSEEHHIFLATGLTPHPRGDFELHAEEAEMVAFWVPFTDLLGAVLEGRVRQGPLVQAVLATEVLRARGEI